MIDLRYHEKLEILLFGSNLGLDDVCGQEGIVGLNSRVRQNLDLQMDDNIIICVVGNQESSKHHCFVLFNIHPLIIIIIIILNLNWLFLFLLLLFFLLLFLFLLFIGFLKLSELPLIVLWRIDFNAWYLMLHVIEIALIYDYKVLRSVKFILMEYI